MALKFTKALKPTASEVIPESKAVAGDAVAEELPANAPVKSAPSQGFGVKPASGLAQPKSGGLSFLKRGAVAQAVFAQEEHKSEQSALSKNRFWLPIGKETSITFLDGDLADGFLDIIFLYEHNVAMNGKYGNFFICTQDEEPCPICEGGLVASYVGMLTVIDHSQYVSKVDGQVHKDNVKLMAVKRETIKILQKLAVKRGGLRGCRFDVSRTGDKSASCGNVFDFTEKLTDQMLVKTYGEKSKPLNYEEVLAKTYMGAKQLRKLGFGSMMAGVGGELPAGGEDYSDEL